MCTRGWAAGLAPGIPPLLEPPHGPTQEARRSHAAVAHRVGPRASPTSLGGHYSPQAAV